MKGTLLAMIQGGTVAGVVALVSGYSLTDWRLWVAITTIQVATFAWVFGR